VKLKASERTALLRGEWPSLSRQIVTGEPPIFEAGETIVLKRFGGFPQVWITISAVRRTRKGVWMPEYTLRDDRPLYLRHNGDLTRSVSESVDPEAPVIDAATERSFNARARLKMAERAEATDARKERQRRRERAVRDRLRETLDGLEPAAATDLLASLEQQIESAKPQIAA
jgi:hypothetical protein